MKILLKNDNVKDDCFDACSLFYKKYLHLYKMLL